MPQPIYANNVAGTIAANIGPADTAILLGAGQGSVFPAISAGNWYYVTLVHNTLGTIEIVKVTGKTADTLTVVRGQDNTVASSFTTGTLVEMRPHAQMMRELDYRSIMGVPNGLATLDGTGKVTTSQLTGLVPLLDVGGKIDMAVIPAAVATDAELANYLPLAGGTVTGALTVGGNLRIDIPGTGAAQLQVGNDAVLIDCNVANMMRLQGVANAAIGYLAFGNANHNIGWDGANFRADGALIWHSSNFDPNTKLNSTNPNSAGANTSASGFYTPFGRFVSQGSDMVLACQGGAMYFRPWGEGNAANQALLYNTGLFAAVDVQSYSDKGRKKFIKRVKPRADLLDLLQLKTWVNKQDGTRGRGLVAQDVQMHADEFVGGIEGNLSLNYAGLGVELALAAGERIRRIEAALNLR